MVIGLAFIFSLKRPLGRRIPAPLLLVPLWIGSVVCISHGLYGLVSKALYLGGVHTAVHFPVVRGVSAATAATQNHLAAMQDVAVFEPCFIILGILLCLAVWQFLSTPITRRRWLVTIIWGVLVIDLLGLVLWLGNWQLAVA